MTTHRKAYGLIVTLVLTGMALAVPAEAQTDSRWTPYLGCWQPAGGSSDGGLLCFRPVDDDIGVEMVTVAEGEIVMTEIFRADGRAQSIEREGCAGSESAEFAADSRRIYTQSLYTCEGDVTRTATGIMSFVSPTQWMDVRSVGVEGEQMAWVQFYESADPITVQESGLADITADLGMALRSTRMAASVPLDFEDILDASAHVDDKAVEAWIAERGDRFRLTGDDLVALDDAGLSGALIDVMVAVSNPNYFVLDGQGQAEATSPMGVRGTVPMRSAWNRYPYGRYYDPLFFDPFYYGFGSRYSFGYSPFGYGGYGGYGGYSGYGGYGYTPTPIVVTQVNPNSGGRVVNGRGYSRGRSTGSSGGSSQPAYRGSGGSSGGSSSSAGSSSSGSSSRGSSTGRTARRRGGG